MLLAVEHLRNCVADLNYSEDFLHEALSSDCDPFSVAFEIKENLFESRASCSRPL